MNRYKGMSFGEIMSEMKPVNRWFIVGVFVSGAFVGALLTVAFMLTALA